MPFDPTKPVQLRNGMEAVVYTTNGGGTHSIIGAYRESPKDPWHSCLWKPTPNYGQFLVSGSDTPIEHKQDLVNIPVKVTLWQNIFRDSTGAYYAGTSLHTSKESAQRVVAYKDYITTIPIAFEDPNGEAPKSPGQVYMAASSRDALAIKAARAISDEYYMGKNVGQKLENIALKAIDQFLQDTEKEKSR